MVENRLQVVYIPMCDGRESAEPCYIQCRAKLHVPCGALRLYPYGGTVLHLNNGTKRMKIEPRFNLKSCYMRCVRASAEMSEECQMYSECIMKSFIMYSALPERVTLAPENQVVLNHIPHFWAVMRAQHHLHNQPKQMSNMIPYMEEYTLGSPEASHLG